MGGGDPGQTQHGPQCLATLVVLLCTPPPVPRCFPCGLGHSAISIPLGSQAQALWALRLLWVTDFFEKLMKVRDGLLRETLLGACVQDLVQFRGAT